MPGQPGELPQQHEDGQWYWADGTAVSWAEKMALQLSQEGKSTTEIRQAIDVATMGGRFDPYTGTLSETGTDPFPGGVPNSTVDGGYFGDNILDGALPKIVGPGTPGAELDTTQADEEQAQLESLLRDLQQQAAEGGGVWEQALADATARASASAQSLGQMQTGASLQSQLRNIGNAQAGSAQRAVGQANILRDKSKMAAQDAISAITSGMGQTAAEQATAAAAARRGVQATNQALIDQAEAREMGRADAIGAGLMSFDMGGSSMSHGGEVPGEPVVFGDDERNDTVPAWLSPDEIVIPRSIATAPNAPELAADFVRALQAREAGAPVQSFADGGEVDEDLGLHQTTVDDDYGAGNAALSFFLPHIGRMAGFGEMRKKHLGPEAPSVVNGGLLNQQPYNAARAAQLQNAGLLQQRAQGQGPSVVPQMAQNTSDANIEAALAAQAAGKHAPDWLQRTTAAQQGAAGEAGMMAAAEQAAGQGGAAKAYLDQQARDVALAQAQQQAQWQKTMMNVGLGLQQQQLVDNLISGAGQALQGVSDIKFGDTDDTDGTVSEPTDAEFDAAFEDEDDYAHGGRIRAQGYAGGGAAGRQPIPAESGYVDPLTAMEQKFTPPIAGVLYDAAGNPIPVPVAPESGTATFTLPGELPQAVMSAAEAARLGGDTEARPMQPGPDRPGLLQRGLSNLAKASREDPFVQLNNQGTDAAMAAAAARPKSLMERDAWIDQQRMDLTAAKKDLGLVPKGEALPAPPGVGAPTSALAAPGAPRLPGAGLPGAKDFNAGIAQQQAAAQQGAEAAAALGRAQADVEAARAQRIEELDRERRQRTEVARLEAQDLMARHQAAVEEMKNINTTVDPGRYWASKTTGQKVLGIVGLALGALGAGRDGINKPAQMLQQAIDRDLDAQKTQYELALRRGQSAVNGLQSAYAQARNLFQDEVAAMNAAKATAYELADSELRKVAALNIGPQAKAQAEALSGQLKAQSGVFARDTGNMVFDNAMKRAQVEAAAGKAAGMGGLSATEQGKVFDVEAAVRNIKSRLASAKEHIRRTGTFELTGPEQQQLQEDLFEVAVDSARLRDPGSTVKEGELAASQAALGIKGGEILLRNKTALQLLENFEKTIEDRRRHALEVRGQRAR